MLDPMPQKSQSILPNSCDESDGILLGKFLLEAKNFKIILLNRGYDQINSTGIMHEVARFSVRGRVLAIVEEPRLPELDGETRNMIARLTGRELQIAAMIAQGDATKNVAYKLRISEWTVGTHLRRIFAKLGVDNRAAMVYRCASLIEQSPPPETAKRRTPTPAG
jgi:DNA-binding CsgD family transcriptional regulator